MSLRRRLVASVAALGLIACVIPPRGVEATQVLPILGSANALVVDSSGTVAYASTGSSVLAIDLVNRRILSQISLTVDPDELGDIDESDTILSLTDFSTLGILNVSSGAQSEIAFGSALTGGSVISNGIVYAPSFNDRGVIARAIVGSFQTLIKPFGPGGPVSCPSGIQRSPDRSVIVFGDECQGALHAINPSTNTVVATLGVGIPPDFFILPNSTQAILVDRDDGTIAFFDLTQPAVYPNVIRLPSLASVTGLALNPISGQLLIAHRVPLDGSASCPDPFGDQPSIPEIVVLDILTRTEVERFRLDATVGATMTVHAYDLLVTPNGTTLVIASDGAFFFVDLLNSCPNSSGRRKNQTRVCLR